MQVSRLMDLESMKCRNNTAVGRIEIELALVKQYSNSYNVLVSVLVPQLCCPMSF